MQTFMRRVTLCAKRERHVPRKEGRRYVQDVKVVLEVFQRLKLIAPTFYGIIIPLESVVCAGEEVDDGSDGVGECGLRKLFTLCPLSHHLASILFRRSCINSRNTNGVVALANKSVVRIPDDLPLKHSFILVFIVGVICTLDCPMLR